MLDIGPRVVCSFEKEPPCYAPGHQYVHFHVYRVFIPPEAREKFVDHVHDDFALVENLGIHSYLVQYRHFESWNPGQVVVRGMAAGVVTVHDSFIDEYRTQMWHLRHIEHYLPVTDCSFKLYKAGATKVELVISMLPLIAVEIPTPELILHRAIACSSTGDNIGQMLASDFAGFHI